MGTYLTHVTTYHHYHHYLSSSSSSSTSSSYPSSSYPSSSSSLSSSSPSSSGQPASLSQRQEWIAPAARLYEYLTMTNQMTQQPPHRSQSSSSSSSSTTTTTTTTTTTSYLQSYVPDRKLMELLKSTALLKVVAGVLEEAMVVGEEQDEVGQASIQLVSVAEGGGGKGNGKPSSLLSSLSSSSLSSLSSSSLLSLSSLSSSSSSSVSHQKSHSITHLHSSAPISSSDKKRWSW